MKRTLKNEGKPMWGLLNKKKTHGGRIDCGNRYMEEYHANDFFDIIYSV